MKRPRQPPIPLNHPHTDIEVDDSCDEQNEVTRVKIGRVPYGWYDQFKNFGYDNKLNPVMKGKRQNKLEEFIMKSENKNWWRTVRDELNMRDVVLTDEQLVLIDRIRSGKMASKTIATSNYSVEIKNEDPFPVNAFPPSKRSFMPSKWERLKVNKILDGLLSGRIPWVPDQQPKEAEQLYDAWASGTVPERGVINIAPMRQKLPGHNQSYNPPKQYLLTNEELKEWQEMDEEDRTYNFVPQAYDKMRKIPAYDRFIHQRFQRCLDLYLCPRIKKKKLNIDPDTLIPKLPDPKLMKPFPTTPNIYYEGHQASVLSVAVSVSGEYLATGDEGGLFVVWDVLTSRKLFTQHFGHPIYCIDWSVGNAIIFSHGEEVELMLWTYQKAIREKAELLLAQGEQNTQKSLDWLWYPKTSQQYSHGYRFHIKFTNNITHLQFQKIRGDYFLTVCPDSQKKNQVIAIHRVSTSTSQQNFIKGNNVIRRVLFYPKKSNILILTNSKIVYFSLDKLQKIKLLSAGNNTYSCITVHPEGGYVLVGSETQKLLCYDLDLSSKPFKTMQYHEGGVTSAHFHQLYPLMASASSDGTIHIFHFKVDSEGLSNAVILPLKVLRGHTKKGTQGVKMVKFHPSQPWIFSIGCDNKVILWT